MANRYWVGGTASWDATAGTKWALTSGGAGGQAVPTASDDVFFDAASGANTVTVAAASVCNNLNFTGFTGTFAGSSTLAISGNLTVVAGMTRTYTGAITFNSTATGKTLTFNGKAMASATTFNGVGGGWTIQDAWNNGTSNITLTAGTLNTNGQTITGGTFNSTNSNTRTLTLGASTINVSNWNLSTATNLTFNSNTSTINISATTGNNIHGGGQTYNIFSYTGGQTTNTLTGANTFATFTFTGFANKTSSFSLSANQIITGTLTINGNSVTNRILVNSNTIGTARTLTVATVSVSNADFMDITGAGAGNWDLSAVAGLSGDCGGNSGITFTTADENYWIGDTGSWSDSTQWSTSSGGAADGRVPLPQDDALFDGNSFSTTGLTVTADMPRLGKNINWTGATNTPTWTLSTTTSIFGSLTLISALTLGAATQNLTFEGRGSYTLKSFGLTFQKPIILNAFGGTLTLDGDLTLGVTRNLIITRGTFSAVNGGSNYVISTGGLQVSATSIASTINLGSATHLITGSNGVQVGSASTFNAGTSTLKFTDTSTNGLTFHAGGKTYNNIWISRGGSTEGIEISGSNTFNDFKDDGTAAHTLWFYENTTTTVTSFTVSGTVGNLISLNMFDDGNPGAYTLVKSGGGTISCNYLNIQHSIATPASTWYAGSNSIDNQANAPAGSGWIFTDPPVSLSLNDTVTVSESVTILIANFVPSVSDTVTVTENLTVLIPILTPSVSDTITVTESVTILIPTLVPAISDTVLVSESVSVVLGALVISVNDTVTVSENLTILIPTLVPSVFDTTTITEAVTVVIPTLVPYVFDTVAVTENLGTTFVYYISVNDTVTISESVSVFIPILFSVFDTTTISENVSSLIPIYFASVFDAITVTDSYSYELMTWGYEPPEYRPRGDIFEFKSTESGFVSPNFDDAGSISPYDNFQVGGDSY